MRPTYHSDTAAGAGGIGTIIAALLGGVARNVDDVARGVMRCGDDVARVAVQPADDVAIRGFSVADDLAARPTSGTFRVESHLARLQAKPARHASKVHVQIDSCVVRGVGECAKFAINADGRE